MGSQNDSAKRVKMTLLVSTQKKVKMTLLKGSSWGQENDSFEGVKMTLELTKCGSHFRKRGKKPLPEF